MAFLVKWHWNDRRNLVIAEFSCKFTDRFLGRLIFQPAEWTMFEQAVARDTTSYELVAK